MRLIDMVEADGTEDAPDRSSARNEKACEIHSEHRGEGHDYILPE